MLRDPIFVVGVPRSGTTLLQCLLSANPKAYSLPETHFFSVVLPRLSKSALETLTTDELRQALSTLRELMNWQIPESASESLQEQAALRNLTGKELFEFLLQWYRPAEDAERMQRVIEKTPGHVEYIQEILEIYPQAKFVHIVRDPRNAISSIIQTTFAPTQWLLWYTQYWNFVLELVKRVEASFPDRVLTIRYEDLVANTAGTLERVCDFLSLQYSAAMLMAFPDEARRNIVTCKEPWKAGNQSAIIYQEPSVWAKRISQREGWLIESYTRRNMQRFGYQCQAMPRFGEKPVILWQSLTYPRRDSQAMRMCHYLAQRCTQMRVAECARFMTMCAVLNDWAQLRDARVRQILFAGI